jgi:hypothetical protein
MKLLIFSAIVAFLLQSNVLSATGGKGSGTYASAQGAGNSASSGSSSRSGGGGMARKPDARKVPPLAEDRKINEQDCSKPVDWTAGNLKCR